MDINYETYMDNSISQNNCLMLTIRKEYKIQSTYRIFNKSLSISFKSIIAGLILTILNILT